MGVSSNPRVFGEVGGFKMKKIVLSMDDDVNLNVQQYMLDVGITNKSTAINKVLKLVDWKKLKRVR